MSIITIAGETLIARQQARGQSLIIDRFVFAHIPGQDHLAAIDRNAGLPEASRIVHQMPVSQTGYVNPSLVVYSAVLPSTLGDFEFNWIGLVSSTDNTLAAISHVPTQAKRATTASITGNTLTRNFMLAFDGAQGATGITVSAASWQIDFTARLAGIDERQRLASLDIYGESAFFDGAFALVREGNQYRVTPGAGYVGGIRVTTTGRTFNPATLAHWGTACCLWLDVLQLPGF